jgi:hypothetical protein
VAHLKKLRRAEGGAKIVGVFRVKNHDFTPKNDIFSNFTISQNISIFKKKAIFKYWTYLNPHLGIFIIDV